MPDTQGLFDTLAGAAGAPVDRPKLEAFVANSQATNGLRTAQTEDALLTAQKSVEEAQAKRQLLQHFQAAGLKPSDAQLASDMAIGGMGNASQIVESLNKVQDLKGQYGLGDPAQTTDPAAAQRATLGQQVLEKKLAGPVAVPNTYVAPPGSVLSTAPVQQTAIGAALTGADVARAEEEHATATQKSSQVAAGSLTPDALHMAAQVVMADPGKITGFTAGGGLAADAKKTAIQNEVARQLNVSGMSTDDMIRQRAITKASVGSVAAAAKQAEILDAFTPLVRSNAERIRQLTAQMTPDELDLPFIDGASRAIQRQGGSADAAELASVFGTYQQEVARLVAGSPSMTGVISDKARADVQSMAPTTMTGRQAERVTNRIDTEIGIRRAGVQSALEAGAGAQLPVTSGAVNTGARGSTGSGVLAPGGAPGSATIPAAPGNADPGDPRNTSGYAATHPNAPGNPADDLPAVAPGSPAAAAAGNDPIAALRAAAAAELQRRGIHQLAPVAQVTH